MPKITITRDAHDAIRAKATAEGGFRDTGKRLADGTIEIQIDTEVLARIEKIRFPGETHSDLIVRLASTGGGMN